MNRPLFWKAMLVVAMTIALLVPLSMIEGQIEARSRRKDEVTRNIAASAAGPQQLVGPLMVVTWLQRVERETQGENGKVIRTSEFESRKRIFVPRTLRLQGKVAVEERHRGLFKAQLFQVGGRLQGSFDLPERGGLPQGEGTVKDARAILALGISDLRGVANKPLLQWGGEALEFQPGAGASSLGHGIHVDLGPAERLAAGPVPFDIPLELVGSQDFSMAPVAEETEVTLQAPWPSPSFNGRYLPIRREVDAKGFTASWKVSSLARNLDAILQDCGGEKLQEAFGVSFMDPVNVYLQAERAVKYGLLFVGLTFAAFFLFELLRRLRIHPMQYLLVGLALALFFLLVISLSEHIPFLWAYLAASAASILLLGTYLTRVLGGLRRGAGFAGGLCVLHAVLYGLLSSEDNALLMGALLLFAALAAVMTATRSLDWYGLGTPASSGEGDGQ